MKINWNFNRKFTESRSNIQKSQNRTKLISTIFFFIFYSSKAEEEARSLQKKIQTVENELDQTQEALTQVNTKLDEKNKALQNVSASFAFLFLSSIFCSCSSDGEDIHVNLSMCPEHIKSLSHYADVYLLY